MPEVKTIIQCQDIVKAFPGVRALDGVSFDIREGEVHSLCGENGAGKSTLIQRALEAAEMTDGAPRPDDSGCHVILRHPAAPR